MASSHLPASKPFASLRLVLVAIVAAMAILGAGAVANPAPVNAGTASTMEANLFAWINAARIQRGVPPLQLGPRLVDFAGDRAAKLASTAELQHPACLGCKFTRRGISFNICGETIAYTTWPWGTQAAQSIFNGWKGSSSHWNLLMSRDFDYIGVGVAYRSANRSTWAAAELKG